MQKKFDEEGTAKKTLEGGKLEEYKQLKSVLSRRNQAESSEMKSLKARQKIREVSASYFFSVCKYHLY